MESKTKTFSLEQKHSRDMWPLSLNSGTPSDDYVSHLNGDPHLLRQSVEGQKGVRDDTESEIYQNSLRYHTNRKLSPVHLCSNQIHFSAKENRNLWLTPAEHPNPTPEKVTRALTPHFPHL